MNTSSARAKCRLRTKPRIMHNQPHSECTQIRATENQPVSLAGKSAVTKFRLPTSQSLGTQRPEELVQADEHERCLGRQKFRQPANKERPECQGHRQQTIVARVLMTSGT